MNRSYDFQRVRSHRPYTITSLAVLFDINPATVRRWIKRDGLNVAIVDESRPIILQGSKVKVWGKALQQAKKRPCASGEMYCVRCKKPSRVNPDSVQIIQHNQSKLTVKGECKGCGMTLHRFGSIRNRASLEAQFGPKPPDSPAA